MNRTLLNGCNAVITFAERPNIEFHISEKEIGRGASCVVYHAVGSDNTEHLLKEYYPKHLDLNRDSSGRILVPSIKMDAYEQGLARFRNSCECQKAIRLSNEDLKNFTCNVQGYYRANGTEYIDMTCFRGQTYDHVQEKSVYNLMLRMRTLVQVVGNYHKAGLLHLDIKPENIYVRPENETIEDVMLFDFDSVTPMSEVRTTKALSCTQTWAAPEQLLPEKRRNICPATDLFAIGEIIFVQLFGRHSTSAERRSFVTKYDYNYDAEIFKDMNPKVFPHLDDLLCHTICGVVDRRYQSAEELIAKLDEIIKIANPEAPYLKNSPLTVQDFFVGRENEVEEIHRKLSENRILFLNGIGGIGKSELAKHYSQEHKDDYDAIIFAPYVSDVNMLLQDDTAIPLYNFIPYPEEKPEEYCARKLRKLQELCDEHTLFIVDNLDREDDPDLNKLLDLNCKLLITTRMDFSDYGYGQQLYLDALCSRNSILEIFRKYYTKPLTEKETACVEQIIDLVAGHTMTVELLAKQMMAGRVKPDKMLSKLQDGGINESGKEKVRSGKDGVLSSQSAYGHIQALFDLSGLNEGERYVLANLSLIPHTGISTELFHDWCELEDYDCLNRLVVEGWVRLDKERDAVSLHPVMGYICQVSCLRIGFVSTLVENIYDFLLNKDCFDAFEVNIYAPLFFSIVKVISLNKIEAKQISRLYHYVGVFFEDNTSRIEFAEDIIEKGLEWDVQNDLDCETLRLSISYYLSVLRANKTLFGSSNRREKRIANWMTIYKAHCGFLIDQDDETIEEQIHALSSAATHHSNLGDNNNSSICYQKTIGLFESTTTADDMFLSENGCDTLMEVATAYENIGRIDKAIDLYFRIIQTAAASKDTVEMAYLGIIGAKIELEEWADGLDVCNQYYQFLNARYESEHKAFMFYYQFRYAILVSSLGLDTLEDCKRILPEQLLEVVAEFWQYKHFNDQYCGKLTTGDKHTVGGLAHTICGYVLYYLSITHAAYEGEETWSEMNDRIALGMLTKAKELFEVSELDEEKGDIDKYIQILNERLN